jgi:FKBP-type peptidyl-prolyl cis-trans isomerase
MELKMIKKVVFSVFLAVNVLFACNAGGKIDKKSSPSESAEGADTDTSYAVGMALGSDLKQQTQLYLIPLNYDAFLQGFRDAIQGNDPRISLEDSVNYIREAMTSAIERMSGENKEKERLFLAENGKKIGVQTTSSGLQYEVITQGSGSKPGVDNVVLVNYEGTLLDGTVFDSSYTRGEPAEFPLDGVIPGWTEGLQLMTVGSTYRLVIPSELAYGDQGAGNFIPPNSTLIFKVELVSIVE